MKRSLLFSGVIALTLIGLAWIGHSRQSDPADPPAAVLDSRPPHPTASYVLRVSDILGRQIVNARGETIGKLDDLIITGDDKVLHAVVAVGGMIGSGDKLITIPYSGLNLGNGAAEPLVYNASKEQLEAKPEFKYKDGQLHWLDN